MRFSPVVLAVVVSIALASCSAETVEPIQEPTDSTPAAVSEDSNLVSKEDLESAVKSVVPNCDFELLRVHNDSPIHAGASEGWDFLNLVPLINIWSDETFGSVADQAKASALLDTSGDGYTNFFACHSRGRTLQELGERGWEFSNFDEEGQPKPVFTDEQKCWTFSWWSEASESFVRGCLDEMAWADKQGFWLVVREHSTQEKARAHIDSLAAEGNSLIGPIFSAGQFTVKLHGNWNPMSAIGLSETQQIWSQLQQNLPETYASSQIPANYEVWTRSMGDKPRELYSQWASIYGPSSSCSNPLKVSELDWSPRQCGVLQVRVFQADLATGSCAFLGYFEDKNGSERIGYFEFCDSFREGAFSEGDRYELRAKVIGSTSYQTRGGWEQSVLAFDVVG